MKYYDLLANAYYDGLLDPAAAKSFEEMETERLFGIKDTGDRVVKKTYTNEDIFEYEPDEPEPARTEPPKQNPPYYSGNTPGYQLYGQAPVSDRKSIFYDKDADAGAKAMMGSAGFQSMMADQQNSTIMNYRPYEPVVYQSPTYLNAITPEQSAKYAAITAELRPRMERDAYIEAARPYVKAAGNTIGGLAGAAVTRHPAGAVALAGVGNAAADNIVDAADMAFGMPNHNTYKDAGINALYNLGEGAFYEGTGQLGARALNSAHLLPSRLNVENPDLRLYHRVPVTQVEHVYQGLPRAEIPSNKEFKKIVPPYFTDDLGQTVNVPRKGVEHAASSATIRGLGKEGYHAEDLSILKAMDEVYPNSRHLESVPDTTPRTPKAGVPQTGTVNYRIAPVKTGDKIYTVKAVEKDLGNGRNFYDMSLQKVLPDGNAGSVTVYDLLDGVKTSEKAGGGPYVEPRFYPAGGLIQTIANELGINPYSKEKK